MVIPLTILGMAKREMMHVTVDGRSLETEWIAPVKPDLPTIVMLHEGLGSVALWRDFPRRIAARTGCGVLVYSRYGYGRSEPLRERREPAYMHHEGEVVLPALLQLLEIRRPVLLGHSDGASIALIYAGTHPGVPRALILEAPHVFVEELSVRSIAAAKVAYETKDLRPKLARYHGDVDSAFYGWNDAWLDPRFRSWNIEGCLDAIACPLLLIQGEDDEYGTRAQLDAIVARLPQAEVLVLPRCGHSPHRDRPDATLARIADFLKARGLAATGLPPAPGQSSAS